MSGLRFLHECPDVYNDLICENDDEFADCQCDFGWSNEDADRIREEMRELGK